MLLVVSITIDYPSAFSCNSLLLSNNSCIPAHLMTIWTMVYCGYYKLFTLGIFLNKQFNIMLRIKSYLSFSWMNKNMLLIIHNIELNDKNNRLWLSMLSINEVIVSINVLINVIMKNNFALFFMMLIFLLVDGWKCMVNFLVYFLKVLYLLL